jgi:predicted kinase
MRGLPGSGKSTTARNLQLALSTVEKPVALYATDDFWIRPNGMYDFNYDLITPAHKWNQKRVELAMMSHIDVIVDNVNTTWKEIEPYVKLAYMYSYVVQLHESDSPWAMNVEECYERTLHGVPYSTILRMYQEWEPTADIRINIEQYEVENV